MTIEVTITVNRNPPGTAVRVDREHSTGFVETNVGLIDAGESWTGNLWDSAKLHLVELTAIGEQTQK